MPRWHLSGPGSGARGRGPPARRPRVRLGRRDVSRLRHRRGAVRDHHHRCDRWNGHRDRRFGSLERGPDQRSGRPRRRPHPRRSRPWGRDRGLRLRRRCDGDVLAGVPARRLPDPAPRDVGSQRRHAFARHGAVDPGSVAQPSPFFEAAVDANGVPVHVTARTHWTSSGCPMATTRSRAAWRRPARDGRARRAVPRAGCSRTVGLPNTDRHDSILLPDGSRYLLAYEPTRSTGKTDAVIQHVRADGQVSSSGTAGPLDRDREHVPSDTRTTRTSTRSSSWPTGTSCLVPPPELGVQDRQNRPRRLRGRRHRLEAGRARQRLLLPRHRRRRRTAARAPSTPLAS